MKRYIRSDKKLSLSDALREIAKSLSEDPDFKDCEISVNKDHNCVDIVIAEDHMYQVYPKKGDKYESYGYRYVYVGPNKGDYERKKYKRTRNSWVAEPELEKHVNNITYHDQK